MCGKQCPSDIGLFLLRLGLGVVFIVQGLQKLFDIGGTTQFLGSTGFPMPMVFTIVLLIIEILGGLAILVGAYTRVAAVSIAIVMVVAMLIVTGPQAINTDAGFGAIQGNIVMLGAALALAFTGAGKLRIGFETKKAGNESAPAPQSSSQQEQTSEEVEEESSSQSP
jgi:putative oxidoreductase